MTVKFTPSGRQQFLDALAFISRDKPSAARRFRQAAATALSRLEEFPASGRRFPEFPGSEYREVIVRPYRFFYRAVGDAVWVVAVWHSAQLPAQPEATDTT